MPSFMYVTGDFRSLSAEEQRKTMVRCGQIDPARVFAHLYGYHANEKQIVAMKQAMDAALPYLTQHQLDLLRAEFGTGEIAVTDLSTPVHALFDYPADANTKKASASAQPDFGV